MPRQHPASIALDPNSETFLIWEQEHCPQTGCIALHMTGRCDDQAMDIALSRAMDGEPFFHAHLDLAWQGGRHLFLWQFETRRPRLEIFDHTGAPAPQDIARWFYDRMQPILHRNMDLAAEFPVRLQMHHLPHNQHLFMCIFHHVVGDAVRILAFLRETVIGYHRLVTSAEAPDTTAPALLTKAGGHAPTVEPRWRYVRNVLRDAIRYPLSRTAVLAGDGDGTAKRTMLHVEITDEHWLAALKNRWRQDGGGLSDLLIASIDLAIEEWNLRRGIPSDVMLNFLAVNQRGRLSNGWIATCANPMGVLPIPVGKHVRKNPEKLLQTIIERRKKGLSRGLDIRFTKDIFRVLEAARRLPFATRKRCLYPILTMRNTIMLSNAGVIWPSLDVQGRPTGDSAIMETGDLEILDFYLSLGCVPTWPLGLVTQSYRRKLYLEFLSWGNLLTERNIADFSALLLRKMAVYL